MADKEAEKKEKERKRLLAVLERNPNCRWALNELKYLDVAPPNLITGGIAISAGGYAADRQYHGGYTE